MGGANWTGRLGKHEQGVANPFQVQRNAVLLCVVLTFAQINEQPVGPHTRPYTHTILNITLLTGQVARR